MKDITPGVQALIDKINNEESTSPESILENIINLMRIYSMEKSSMELSKIFLITQDGKFSPCPVKPGDARGPLGDMLMKKYIEEFRKNIKVEINSLVEFNFGHGIVAKIKKKDFPDQEERFTDIERRFKEQDSKGIEDEPEFQDYFVVNIMTKKNVNVKIYDIIKADDNSDAFVIANKPTVEHNTEYDGEKLINYLKD